MHLFSFLLVCYTHPVGDLILHPIIIGGSTTWAIAQWLRNVFISYSAQKRFMEIPEINSKVLSVRLEFCDRFSSIRDERFFMFLTPVSVNPPPHISRDLRFLKSASSNKGEVKGRRRINSNQKLSVIWTIKVQSYCI